MRQEKIEKAISAVTELVDFFQRMNMAGWAKRYREISLELASGNVEVAVTMEINIVKVNAGRLYDLYISKQNGHSTENKAQDNELFQKFISAVSVSFSELRKELKGYIKKSNI
jgi:hypothetical protein